MPQQPWSTLRATGNCHLVVVENSPGATELKNALDDLCDAGDYALDDAGTQTYAAFTSFADVERFTAALRAVRSVRQLETRWASQWDGTHDKAALARLQGDVRRMKRAARQAPIRP